MIFKTTLTILFLTVSQLIYSNQSERIRFTDINFYSIENIDYSLKDTLKKNGRLILNYRLAGRFSIDYAIDGLSSNEKIQYKIEGFDYDWIPNTECKSIMTTNLLAGRYLIRIGIFIDDNLTEERSIDLIITPPWWKTWWFRAFTTLGFIGLFLIVIIVLIINNSRLRKKLSDI